MGVEGIEEETRQAIMAATYRALCEHGYANLTMKDIAAEFDKSKSLLHYHYDTKEDLLVAFLDHIVGWMADHLAQSDTEAPLERLDEFLEKFVIEPDEGPYVFALALLELRLQAVHNEVFREKLAEHYAENVATVARIIEDGIDAGVFQEVDPDATAEAIYTAMEGARMYQVTLGDENASRAMRAAIEDFVVADLLDG